MITQAERAKDLGMLVFSHLDELANAVWVPPCLAADFLSALSGLEAFEPQTLAAAEVADILAQALRVREENRALLAAAARYDATMPDRTTSDALRGVVLGLIEVEQKKAAKR